VGSGLIFETITGKLLTTVEKLNCLCDSWAKGARSRGAINPRDPSRQLLPRESATVFIHDIKQNGDLADNTRFELGLHKAREFYTTELHWDRDKFDRIDWWSLDFTLSKQSKMFLIWLAKQASSFCGTRLMTSRMSDNSENCCPNCLLPDERAYHLNLCPNQERTRQFHETIEQLEKWLDRSHTHPQI
jgi:hypothetical protein